MPKSIKVHSLAIVLIIALLSVISLHNVFSAPNQSTDARIKALEKRIAVLETKVQELHDFVKSPPKGQGQNAKPGSWKVLANWRLLHKGMAKKEVLALLGEPTKITVYPFSEDWHYGDVLGGEVSFSNTGQVETWSEPQL